MQLIVDIGSYLLYNTYIQTIDRHKMSTNSIIAIENDDGSVWSVYTHWTVMYLELVKF